MKIYEIVDATLNLSVGVLLYYEKEKNFIIELVDTLDEWNAPLLLTSYVKRGIFTIPRDISFLWVKERVIPSGRQNIGSILTTHKLKAYDEMKFLELASGRCSQDDLYIKKLDELPNYVKKRQSKNLLDCTPLENNTLLCFFADGQVRRISLSDLASQDNPKIEKVIKNKALYNSCRLGTDGYYITFNNSIDVPAELLYKSGTRLPVEYQDFIAFAVKNTCDTQVSCKELSCSRQNLSYLAKQGSLSPIKENLKGNLYLKRDVIKNQWK